MHILLHVPLLQLCPPSSAMKIKFKFQVSQLNSLLHELDCLVHRKLNSKCAGDKSEVSCHQQKIDLEVEIHQTNLAYEQTELRLKQVDMEAKQNLDKLKDLRCQVYLTTNYILK